MSHKNKAERFEDQPEEAIDKQQIVVGVPISKITRGMKPRQVRVRLIQFIICMPVFFFLFTSALCGYQIYTLKSTNVEEFSSLVDVLDNIVETNCLNAPIKSIQLGKKGETGGRCTAGYERIWIGTFYGSREGCFNPTEKTVLSSTTCSENSVPINATAPYELMYWRDHFFCVQRIQEFNYTQNRSGCKSNQKACKFSPGYICVGASENCPITDVRVQLNQVPVPKTYTAVPLDSSLQLIYTNDPETPRKLMGFDFTLNGLSCLDPLEAPFRMPNQRGSGGYPLMEKVENGCDMFGSNFDNQIIDTYPEQVFLKQNQLKLVLDLPLMSEYIEGNNISLNAQYTMSVKNSEACWICQPDVKEGLDNIREPLWKTYNIYLVFSKFGVILIVVMVLTALFNFVSCCILRKNLVDIYLRVMKVNMCVFSYMMGHFVTTGVLITLNYMRVSSSIKQLNEFVDAKCFNNNNVNEALKELHQTVLPTIMTMTINGGLIIVLVIISVSVVILANYILSGIKKTSGTDEETKPLRAPEIELEGQRNSKRTDESKEEEKEQA